MHDRNSRSQSFTEVDTLLVAITTSLPAPRFLEVPVWHLQAKLTRVKQGTPSLYIVIIVRNGALSSNPCTEKQTPLHRLRDERMASSGAGNALGYRDVTGTLW